MHHNLKLGNGGREIAQIKKDKYHRKTFNYDEQQLQAIKEIFNNRHDLIDKRKGGKFQNSFASNYKITQNPHAFNGGHTKASKVDVIEENSRNNFHKRAKSMMQA